MKGGNPMDFMALVTNSYSKVYYHCLKEVRSNHDAADITQNTFIKAFIHFGNVRDINSREPWLFTICNNEIKQFYRNSKKSTLLSEAELETAELHAAKPRQPQPAESYDILYSAIDQLSDIQRQVVLLKYFGGYSMAELAIILSISQATVKSRLYEARKAMKRLLDSSLHPSYYAGTPGTASAKKRRTAIMAAINLCAIGAQTIPCMSLHAQKQLLQNAKDNAKFAPAVLAELASITTGQEFMEACNGKLSYDELLRILACCDDSVMYRLGGTPFGTWRNAAENPLVKDVTKLYKSGGYVDSVEPILRVKSIRETCDWYKKYLGWNTDSSEEDIKQTSHAIISPYMPEGTHVNYGHFKGFHLWCGEKCVTSNSAFFIFVSGLKELRADIIERGSDSVSEIKYNAWGTNSFKITDINGTLLQFCEWACEL